MDHIDFFRSEVKCQGPMDICGNNLVNTISSDGTAVCFLIKLGRHVYHGERMNPIDFLGQKVKVTRDMYGDKLENTIESKPLWFSS